MKRSRLQIISIKATNVTIDNSNTVNNHTPVKSKRCSKCKEVKLIENFSKNKGRKDGYANECKACTNTRYAEYIQRPEVVAKKKDYRKRYNQTHLEAILNHRTKTLDRKSKALQIIRIASKCCEKCGTNNPNILETDHIDVSLKKRWKTGLKISAMSALSNAQQIIEEFLSINTRVLCVCCHRKHTTTQRNHNVDADLQKKRSYIALEKKEIGKCAHCEFDDMSDTAAFDFDHLDPETKSYAISHMVNVVKIVDFERLVDIEIAKCQLLCANCHRIKTRKEQNTYLTPEIIETLKKDVLEGKYDDLSPRMSEIKKFIK